MFMFTGSQASVGHQQKLLDDLFRHYDKRIRPYVLPMYDADVKSFLASNTSSSSSWKNLNGSRSAAAFSTRGNLRPPFKQRAPLSTRPILIHMTIVLGILIEMVGIFIISLLFLSPFSLLFRVF